MSNIEVKDLIEDDVKITLLSKQEDKVHSNNDLVFNNVKNQISKEILLPNYVKEVRETISSRNSWRKYSNYAEFFSKIFTGCATIVAFSAGSYPDYTYLSFIAGCIGTVALVTQQFSTYAKGESKERTNQANIILNKFQLETIPNIIDESINP